MPGNGPLFDQIGALGFETVQVDVALPLRPEIGGGHACAFLSGAARDSRGRFGCWRNR